MTTRESATSIPRGDLDMVVCNECGFVFNRGFDASNLAYGTRYDNSQTWSSYFASYVAELARHLVLERNVRNCRVVEVGCGNGSFLRALIDLDGAGNTGLGFDPSYAGPTSDLGGRLKFSQSYYEPQSADLAADVVVCRHVIEHVPRPVELLLTIRRNLERSAGARVFLETPCVGWILRNEVVSDFFYEHCSLFTAESLTTACERAGLRVEAVRHVFNGQYLWLEAAVGRGAPEVTKDAGAVPRLAGRFASSEQALKSDWVRRVRRLAARGKPALWGAGAKGSTFANLVDPRCDLIDCIVDLNPNKQGHYLPGTGHPIVDYRELTARGVTDAILMNPNYRDEVRMLLRNARIQVNLIEH